MDTMISITLADPRMYGQPSLSQTQYNRMFSTQIGELLLGYGESDFVWWWDVHNSPREGFSNNAQAAAINAQLDCEVKGSDTGHKALCPLSRHNAATTAA